jgi:hypothetical protein
MLIMRLREANSGFIVSDADPQFKAVLRVEWVDRLEKKRENDVRTGAWPNFLNAAQIQSLKP